MNIQYPKYPPGEVFISFCGRNATEAELWQGLPEGIVYNKQTGNEFLDLFVSIVHDSMEHDTAFYAKKLGVTKQDLSGCLKVLTGLGTGEWIDAYVQLAVCDLLRNTDFSISEIARLTGYPDLRTLSHAFGRIHGMPPSRWREKYK